MSIVRLRAAVLLLAGSFTLAACNDGYGYGGMSVGYGAAGYCDPRWDDCTALHGSIISGQPSITRYLVEQGAQVDAKNALGWTPLMMARGVFLANASREFPQAEAVLLEALEK